MDVHLIVVDLTKHEKGFSVQRCETAVRSSLTREFGKSVQFFFYAQPWVAQYLSAPQQTQLAKGVPEVIKLLAERIARIGRERTTTAPRILVASYNFYVRRDAREAGRRNGVTVGTIQLADDINGVFPPNQAEIEWSDAEAGGQLANLNPPHADSRHYYSEPERRDPPTRPEDLNPTSVEPRRYYSEPERRDPPTRPEDLNPTSVEPRRYYSEPERRHPPTRPEDLNPTSAEPRRYYSEPERRHPPSRSGDLNPPSAEQPRLPEPAHNHAAPPSVSVIVNMPQAEPRQPDYTATENSGAMAPEKYARSRKMRASAQKAKLFNEKPTRDLLFKTIKIIVERKQHLQLSALRRTLAEETFAHSGFSDKAKWDAQVYFFCRLLLFSHTLVGANEGALSHGASADGTEVHDLSPNLEDDAEGYLIEHIIRDLGDVTEFEHIPLAHAILRQFDTALDMGTLKDRIALLISKVSERLTLDESGVYIHRIGKPSLRAVK